MEFAPSLLVMGQITPLLAWGSGFAPAIDNYQAGDVAVANSNAALAATQRATRRMAANQSSSTTIYADVPDLTVTINRVGPVTWEYWLAYITSSAGEGIGVQLAFSGTSNNVRYSTETYITGNTPSAVADVALQFAIGFSSGQSALPSGPSGATAIINLRGSCNVTAVGDLKLQLKSKTGGGESSTLLVGSWAQVLAA